MLTYEVMLDKLVFFGQGEVFFILPEKRVKNVRPSVGQ